jgi:hypothetical protein
MKRTPLSLKLDKLTGTPLKAMLWHLNETVNGPYITADNMRFCTDLAIYEALSLLEKESADMFAQVLDQLGLKR